MRESPARCGRLGRSAACFAPLSVRPPGRLNTFPAYSVKTHMIISRSILLTTAHRAIFQCSPRTSVFRDTLEIDDHEPEKNLC